jgi:hypothetical protein
LNSSSAGAHSDKREKLWAGGVVRPALWMRCCVQHGAMEDHGGRTTTYARAGVMDGFDAPLR